ncbi:MAG: glycoside hydrolase family 9 protein [Paludibacteraceae bacterium]|nr:glycoside hydrolase family 9 protein [Paludibacteraceae bacterium]
MSKLKYSVLGFLCSIMCSSAYAQVDLSFSNEQYQKALWMTTRFYGAQRMGEGVNWLVATHEANDVSNEIQFDRSKFVKGKSFLKDADGDYDLTGGWFDCGDFVLFGQTFFYSAYMLLLGYTAFPEGYPDFYSEDYHGYIDADDYTWEGKKGEPDGIPDILNEVKYATDFILKAVRDNRTFYYQKGDGDVDHKVWCTSTVKSAIPVSLGGEADGPRLIAKANDSVTAMASQAGATLAAMARVYAKYDADYAATCLEKAKVACEFVETTEKGTSWGEPLVADGKDQNFYHVGDRYVHDMVTMYVELYKTTKDPEYLRKAEENCAWMNDMSQYDYNFSLCYDHREDLAAYAIASLGEESSYGAKALEILSFYVNTMYKPVSGTLLNKQTDDWGVLRYPANQAFVYALYDKLTNAETINPYTSTSIDYIMGHNGRNFSYIVGFGDKYPSKPHHRNVYRTDIRKLALEKDKLPSIDNNYKFSQLGYLVGGSLNDGEYTDEVSGYEGTEGGIDYNAGLVGALAYINAKINPVPLTLTSVETSAREEISCVLSPNPVQDRLNVHFGKLLNEQVKVEVIDALGCVRLSKVVSGQSYCGLDCSGLEKGIYIVRVIAGDESFAQQLVKN